MAAAAAMVAGCYKPEMNQIAAPEDVVAPVLEAVEGPIEITPSNMVDGVVAFTWSAADYGVPTQINYSLEAATAAAPDAKVTITSGITTTSAEVDYETLNAILFNDLKLADGVAEDVNFCIGVKVDRTCVGTPCRSAAGHCAHSFCSYLLLDDIDSLHRPCLDYS